MSIEGTGRGRARGLRRGITALALAALAAALSVAEAGDCSTVVVDGRVLLPDGSEHDGTMLTLCVGGALSPVASFVETWIDRHPVGVAIGRRGRSEGDGGSAPFMTFRRDGRGRLVLYGFAVPQAEGLVTYLLTGHEGRRRKAAPPAEPPRETLLVAAVGP